MSINRNVKNNLKSIILYNKQHVNEETASLYNYNIVNNHNVNEYNLLALSKLLHYYIILNVFPFNRSIRHDNISGDDDELVRNFLDTRSIRSYPLRKRRYR